MMVPVAVTQISVSGVPSSSQGSLIAGCLLKVMGPPRERRPEWEVCLQGSLLTWAAGKS